MRERSTRQKEAVADVFRRTRRPLSRCEVHHLAARRVPRIGFATVSRIIDGMIGRGEVVSVVVPGSEVRYERPCSVRRPRLHCLTTGHVYTLAEACPEIPFPQIAGFQIDGFELIYRGVRTGRSGSEAVPGPA